MLCRWLIIYNLVVHILAQSNRTIAIPAEDTYLLPRPFNNHFTKPFVNSFTGDQKVNRLLNTAQNSSFISYDEEFDQIVGLSAEIRLVASDLRPFAFEAGIWVAGLNQLWFTGLITPNEASFISILDLNTNVVSQPSLNGPGAQYLVNPNGGYYFNGTVYIGTFGNKTVSPGLFAVDSQTFETTEVINSVFGLPINGPDDITVAVSAMTGHSCLFFSDYLLSSEGLPTWPGPQQLPYAVWRFTPHDKNLRAVISPLNVEVPNGIAVDRTNSLIYITDNPNSVVFGTAINETSGSAGIYQFDLGGQDGCTPMDGRLFGFARQGFANGVKVDDFGRVWTAEYEGIVVRNTKGKVIGVFNALDILRNSNIQDIAPVANFGLAEDQLIFLASDKVLAVTLTQRVKTWY